jgi:hypothetical protein
VERKAGVTDSGPGFRSCYTRTTSTPTFCLAWLKSILFIQRTRQTHLSAIFISPSFTLQTQASFASSSCNSNMSSEDPTQASPGTQLVQTSSLRNYEQAPACSDSSKHNLPISQSTPPARSAFQNTNPEFPTVRQPYWKDAHVNVVTETAVLHSMSGWTVRKRKYLEYPEGWMGPWYGAGEGNRLD